MRTSQSQFELMVDFMERNGDLSKPTSGPQGKITTTRLWDTLRDLLNQDPVGETKSTEKWRKTWSDFKNNCKRKAARIHASATRTGGGPASILQLTPLESRVMQIIGMQAATGIPSIPEIGLGEIQQEHQSSDFLPLPQEQNTPRPGHLTEEVDIQVLVESLESEETTTTPTPNVIVVPAVFEPQPGPSGLQQQPCRDSREDPERNAALEASPQPGPSGLQRPRAELPRSASREHGVRNVPLRSPIRRRGVRRQLLNSPAHRRFRETQADRVASQFLRCDEEWRQFRIEQDRENRRLRSRELDLQERWQDISIKILDMTERILNKYLDS